MRNSPTSLPLSLVVAFSVSVAISCGGRSVFLGNNQSGNNQNQNNQNNQNQNNNNGQCGSAADCVVAIKHDACCSCPVAASPADLAADPCLLPIGQSAVPAECQIACPFDCGPCPEPGALTCSSGQCGFAEGQCVTDQQCIAAIRVDNCCGQAFPSTHAEVAADPCLQYWPNWWQDTPAQCFERWDPACDLIDCAPGPPESRAMTCQTDGCGYVPECQGSGDCTLLIDTRQCCACAEAWPASMADHDPCLVPPGATPPAGCVPDACSTVLCEACLLPPGVSCESSVCLNAPWP